MSRDVPTKISFTLGEFFCLTGHRPNLVIPLSQVAVTPATKVYCLRRIHSYFVPVMSLLMRLNFTVESEKAGLLVRMFLCENPFCRLGCRHDHLSLSLSLCKVLRISFFKTFSGFKPTNARVCSKMSF